MCVYYLLRCTSYVAAVWKWVSTVSPSGGSVCVSFTLSMMIAALDALTVMETMARVIPTAATTNTCGTPRARDGQLNNAKKKTQAVVLPCQTVLRKVSQVNGSAHQDVKSDEDGAGGEADLGPSWWKLPHQEHEEGHIWHQQQQVPKAHPNARLRQWPWRH